MPKRQEHKESHPVLDALNAAVERAEHLGPLDAPVVEAARALALKIDMADKYFEALADDAADKKLRPPSQDNVSIPTFLKYCDSLGLTPIGRTRAEIESRADNSGSKLGKLRAAHARSA